MNQYWLTIPGTLLTCKITVTQLEIHQKNLQKQYLIDWLIKPIGMRAPEQKKGNKKAMCQAETWIIVNKCLTGYKYLPEVFQGPFSV